MNTTGRSRTFPPSLSAVLLLIVFLPRLASAFCHTTEVVRQDAFRIIPVADSSTSINIEWLGHSAFLLTSSKGTQVLMDPHGRLYPPPPVFPHVITTSHLHGNHSFIWMAQGNPIVLQGLKTKDGDWNRIHRVIRDVSIYTVPAYHDSQNGMARGKNSIFVVSMDQICVAHLGDLGHLLNETQIKMMGKIDVLFVPLGQGGYRIGSEDAAKIVDQVKPKVVIPYHYDWKGFADEFAGQFPQVRKLSGNSIKLSKSSFNSELEIIVLKDTLGGMR